MASINERLRQAVTSFTSGETQRRLQRYREAERQIVAVDSLTEEQRGLLNQVYQNWYISNAGQFGIGPIDGPSLEPKVEMKTDLMALVNECQTPTALVEATKVDTAIAKAELLKSLGFVKAAEPVLQKATLSQKLKRIADLKFIAIKTQKITAFLQRLGTEYNKQNGVDQEGTVWNDYCVLTCHSRGYKGVGKFEWSETPIDKYEGIPPEGVLKRFAEVKETKVFDRYSVATVKAVKDPLLLGHIDGSEDRYFIAQWGDDVKLDDVI